MLWVFKESSGAGSFDYSKQMFKLLEHKALQTILRCFFFVPTTYIWEENNHIFGEILFWNTSF